jgi:hypothetical protein
MLQRNRLLNLVAGSMFPSKNHLVLIGSILLVLNVTSDEAADAHFTDTVLPVLNEHCFKCHGAEGKAKAG